MIYNLSETIEYAKDGDFHKTATIEFTGPSMGVYEMSLELSQYVTRAMMDAQDFLNKQIKSEVEKEEDSNMTGDAMKIILMSSKSVKFSDIANCCKKLFLKVGTYDGEVKLKDTIFSKISLEDFISMVCEYIANFIFPSLFSQAMGE